MDIYYHCPTRKKHLESTKLKYLPKLELIKECNFISIHTPPFNQVLDENDFNHLSQGKVVISVCQGKAWDHTGMLNWLKNRGNRLILDQFAFSQLVDQEREELINLNNVRISPIAAYYSIESINRIAQIFVKNLLDFANTRIDIKR